MARTRRTTAQNPPVVTTQNPPAGTLASTVEVSPHSTYAATGGNNPAATTDLITQGTNLQLQTMNAPLNNQAPGFQMSTIVIPGRTGPNPTYGMPHNFEAGGSGHAPQPQYIRGLTPIPEGRDFSGPYTDEGTDPSTDEDTHHRSDF